METGLIYKMKEETLKLDFDDISFREIKKIFRAKGLWIRRFYHLKLTQVNVYRTKGGYHIYIWVNNKLSNFDIVFLQLAFGSDFRRECYYHRKIRKKIILPKRGWNIFFFRKTYSKKSRKNAMKFF